MSSKKPPLAPVIRSNVTLVFPIIVYLVWELPQIRGNIFLDYISLLFNE
jgi:hypothetical protein